MKKKIAILSTLATISPLCLLISSCSIIDSNINKNITNAQLFSAQYSKIASILEINSLSDFVNELELGYKYLGFNEWDLRFLAKLRGALGINMNMHEIFVLNNSVKIDGDTLKFVFVNDTTSYFNGTYLEPSKNAIYYNVSLLNINNNSTIFKNHPQKTSNLFKGMDFASNTQDVYNSVNNTDNIVNVGDSQYQYFYDSQIVNDFIANVYKNTYNENNVDDYFNLFMSDLNLSLKQMINYNIDSWNQYLYNSDLFISIQNESKNESNIISPIIYLQIKNSTNNIQTFDFFNLKINIYPNEYLSLKANLTFDFKKPSVGVNKDSYVGYIINNPTISYELSSKSQIINSNLMLMLNKSKSINTKLNNISFSVNNPYNEEINNIISNELNNLKIDEIKQTVENTLSDQFNQSKELAIANYSWLNAFNIDINKNPNYSFYDAIIKIKEPIKTIYENTEYQQYAEIISCLFSDMPIYEFFHKIFDDLMNILASNESLNVIYIFLYDNLTINGTKKSLKKFKTFFINIKNLKPILLRLIATSLDPYVISYILLLIDALSDPEQTLWLFLSNNLSYILNILQSLVPSISTEINSLKNIKIKYKNQLINNMLTDIPLYDFLSANNVTVENPLSINNSIINFLSDLKTTFNLLLTLGNIPGLPIDINQLKPIIKLIEPITPIIQLLVNGVLSCITGQSVKSYTANQYQNYFKNQLTLINNNQEINMIDYLKNENNYKITNLNWSDKSYSNNYYLNSELNFDLSFEPFVYQNETLSNIKYKFVFNNSKITPFFDNNKKIFSWYLNSYYLVNTSIKSDTLSQLAINSNNSANYLINSNKQINNLENYLNDYADNVIYPNYQIKLINQLELPFDYKKSLNQIISIKNLLNTNTYYELNNEQYLQVMDLLKNNINTINLDFSTIKPYIQLVSTKSLLSTKYKLLITFPVNIYTNATTNFFTKTIEINLK